MTGHRVTMPGVAGAASGMDERPGTPATDPDHNQQHGTTRTCFACGHTSVPRPYAPGWTPYRELGWLCPRCSLVERF